MTPSSDTRSALFPDLFAKPLKVVFDSKQTTSDGGAVLLQLCDRLLGVCAALAGVLDRRDQRQPAKTQHSCLDLVRQRLFAMALGYFYAIDAARLRSDPTFKTLAGRDPAKGADLASQPTLSRFENAVDNKILLRMATECAEAIIARQRQRRGGKAKVITIDVDPTCDPTHGGQQLSLFNGFYNTHCYLPMAFFLTFDNELEQYLVCSVLRPGNAPANLGLLPVLKRLAKCLRKSFKKVKLRIRLDAGFQGPKMLKFFRTHGLQYVVCASGNPVLQEKAKSLKEQVEADWKAWDAWQAAVAKELQALLAERAQGVPEPPTESERRALRRQAEKRAKQRLQKAALGADPKQSWRPPRKPQARYGDCVYQAGSWKKPERVVLKAELAEHAGRARKINVRFVITNVQGSAQRIYWNVYCRRGDVENRIKELKNGVGMDCTSCTSFKANSFRVQLAVAAYALMQELRWGARGTKYARTQASWLQRHLLKLAARVKVTVRRIVFHLPETAPCRDAWLRIAAQLGAAAP